MTQKDNQSERMLLDVSVEQAQAVSRALDAYSRLGIGQLQIIEELIMDEQIPFSDQIRDLNFDEKLARRDTIRRMLGDIKQLLGFTPGSSLGITHERVPRSALLSWTVKKEIEQKLAYHRDPNPSFKGVNYDGNNLNISGLPDEDLPRAVIIEGQGVADNLFEKAIPQRKRSPK